MATFQDTPALLDVDGTEVTITNPHKIYFPEAGITKLDLVHYYLTVGEGVLRGIRRRPIVLKRYVDGIGGNHFFQKRAPKARPFWVNTVILSFPSGRGAEELVISNLAQLAWTINLGCIDLNPHPIRADDLDHPDELRIDLDPTPGTSWDDIRQVALLARDVLSEHGLAGWPKTSGSRGIHINVRIERSFSFEEVRRAALAVAREVERRAPDKATSKWWKEERQGVFLDYNQNAKDRTVASAYSVRPNPGAWVSAPLSWDELPACELASFTLKTMPERYAKLGDLAAGIDDTPGSLDGLLGLAERQEAEGLGDAPWPPHYPKMPSEPPRAPPSRRQRPSSRPGRPKAPLLVVAKAAKVSEALAGLARWQERHPAAAAHLREQDVLIDSMRGRYSTWTRIRVNLINVPEEQRPPEEPPDPDYNPWSSESQPPPRAES